MGRRQGSSCTRLDGLPLAIELAAARVGLLTPQEMLSRLERHLSMLGQGPRDAPARQQTLAATIAWSHSLLNEDEQIMFRRLGVFAGGCTLPDLEAVCIDPDSGVPSRPALDLVASLVAKNLLERVESAGGTRFRMLETVRREAVERMVGSGEETELRLRHARRFEALTWDGDEKLHGREAVEYLRRLAGDMDNIRAALETLSDHDEYESVAHVVTSNGWGWHLCDHFHEGRFWLDRVVADRRVAAGLQALAHGWAGAYATLAGHYSRAAELTQTAEDIIGITYTLRNWASSSLHRSDYRKAERMICEALPHFGELDDTWSMALIAEQLSIVAIEENNDGLRTARLFGAAARIRRELGTPTPRSEGVKIWFAALNEGLSNAGARHDDTISVGDKVVILWTGTGTHTGEIFGVPPSGKDISVLGIDIFRIQDGKIVEMWQSWDQLGMMRQIGAL